MPGGETRRTLEHKIPPKLVRETPILGVPLQKLRPLTLHAEKLSPQVDIRAGFQHRNKQSKQGDKHAYLFSR